MFFFIYLTSCVSVQKLLFACVCVCVWLYIDVHSNTLFTVCKRLLQVDAAYTLCDCLCTIVCVFVCVWVSKCTYI